MEEEAYLEFYPIIDMMRDYFMKALQGYQFCRYRYIVIGIHEDDIPPYNENRPSTPPLFQAKGTTQQ